MIQCRSVHFFRTEILETLTTRTLEAHLLLVLWGAGTADTFALTRPRSSAACSCVPEKHDEINRLRTQAPNEAAITASTNTRTHMVATCVLSFEQ